VPLPVKLPIVLPQPSASPFTITPVSSVKPAMPVLLVSLIVSVSLSLST
jgi:hypothetical protein